MTLLRPAHAARTRLLTALVAVVLILPLLFAGGLPTASAHGGALDAHGDETDPARNVPLPCEQVPTPGTPGRAARNIVHVANVCGIVGTDVEFQSRRDSAGRIHNYAFVGTMGAGVRIYDVTRPATPIRAGGYIDTGWQNDVQVRGDLLVSTFDGVVGEDSTASTCLKARYPEANGQGVDVIGLRFNPTTAKFTTVLATCIANPPGGAHNSTLHVSGNYLAISNPSSDWAVDVIDIRGVTRTGKTKHSYRLIDASRRNSPGRCPATADYRCITVTRPNGTSASGLWRPHDVSFSRDGKTMYVAALNATFIMDVSGVLDGSVRTIAIIPNKSNPADPDATENIQLSHQADVSSDGKVLVVADEKGGGTSNTNCNTSQGEKIIGALHFYALTPLPGVAHSAGASPSTPKKLGVYINPQPIVGPDVLQPVMRTLPRSERGCTVHVFRLGGNGTAGPGQIATGFDGISRLSSRRLTTAWYGAGVWHMDFSSRPDVLRGDTTREDPQTTWGNTLGWNVQPGADTWSAKEYKGYIYAGDIIRGFDVYRFATCDGAVACRSTPSAAQRPASASAGLGAGTALAAAQRFVQVR